MQISIPPGAYELESLNSEIKTIIFEAGHLVKQNMHLQANSIFRHQVLSSKFPDKNQNIVLLLNIVYEIFWV